MNPCGTGWPSASTSRRRFLQGAIGAAGVPISKSAAPGAPVHGLRWGGEGLIDVNVSLGHWPMRRVRCDDPKELANCLRRNGVLEAWAGTLEGVLHKDVGAANARLADQCREFGRGLLIPFGTINPNLPDWEEELDRCARRHRMRGIRLHPNYHGYGLEDPVFARLLERASRQRLIVQLALVMEDERMMHPLMRVAPVDASPLAGVVRQVPGLRLILLNALRTLRAKPLLDVMAAGDVSVEIATLEGVGGVAALLAQAPVNRLLFGSHAPMYYFESALLKLKESALTTAQMRAIGRGNARRLQEF